MYPICGDPSRMTSYFYCRPSSFCERTAQGKNGRYQKIVDDSGDVCSDELYDCKCYG